MRCARIVGANLLAALLACTGKPASGNRPPADSVGMGPAAASPAKLKAMAMLPSFRAHVDSVAAKPSMMRGSMPEHRAEVEAMVNAMHADMMGPLMHSDAAYEALADSVVKGATSLGDASGPEFDRLVKQHVDQMRRLASAYETKAAAMTK